MSFNDKFLTSAVFFITTLMISSGFAVALFNSDSVNAVTNSSNSSNGINTYLMTVTMGNQSYTYYEEVQNGKVIKTWPAPSQDLSNSIRPSSYPAQAVSLSSQTSVTEEQSIFNSNSNVAATGQVIRGIGFAPSIGYGPIVSNGVIVKDSGSNSGSTSPSSTFKVPSASGTISVIQGDTIVAMEYSTYSGLYGTSPSKASGTSAISGFTAVYGAQISGSGYGNLQCWYTSVTSSGTLQVTFNSNGAGVSNDIYGLIFDVSGVAGWSINVGTGSGTGKADTISSSVSYATGDVLVGLLGAVGDIGAGNPIASGSWSVITTYGGSQHDATGSTANEYMVTTSSGTISPSTTLFSTDNSRNWLTTLLDFTPPYTGPSSISLDQGQSVLLSSSDGNSYYWWVDSTYTGTHNNIFEYTTSSYGYTGGSSTSHIVILSDSSTSNTGAHNKASATVTVYPSVSINLEPSSAIIDSGYSITLTAVAQGGTGLSNIVWQWYDTSGKMTGKSGTGYTATLTLSTEDAGIYAKFIDEGVLVSATGSGSEAVTSVASVTVNPALLPPTLSPSSTILDRGQSVEMSFTVPTTGTPPYTHQWYYGSNYTAISGATGTTYTFSTTGSTSLGMWEFYVAVTDSATIPVTVDTASVTVVVNTAPSVSIDGATVDSGMTATLTAAALGGSGTGYVYTWYSDAGLTNLLYTGNPYETLPLSATTTYYVVVTDSILGVSSAEPVTVTVNEFPTILSNPSSYEMDADQAFIMLTSEVQYGTGPYSWVWYNSYGDPAGSVGTGTTATYTPTESGSYYVVFSDYLSQTATSESATVVVNPVLLAPVIDVSPHAIDDGQQTTLSISSPAAGGTTPYSYEWYVSVDGITYLDYATSDGSSPELTGPLSTGEYHYYLEVTDSATMHNSQVSNIVTIKVNAVLTSSSVNVVATQSEVDIGQDLGLYVDSFDGSGTPAYIAQWLCWSPSDTGFVELSGEFSFDTVTLSDNSYSILGGLSEEGTWQFELSLTDSGNPGITVYSNIITVTVAPELTVYIGGPSTIDSTQPEALTAYPGGGSGSYTSYQWYQDFSPVGGDSNTFDLSALSVGSHSFYVTVTDSNGFTVNSVLFYVTVNSTLIAPTAGPASTYLDMGQSILLTSSTIDTGTYPYYYQWYQDGSPIETMSYPMAASDSFYFATGLFDNGTGTYSFYLEVTDSAATPMVVDSNEITVVVNEQLTATDVSPVSGSFDQGGSVILSLGPVTTGTPPYYYQWTAVYDGLYTDIPGANADSYLFSTTSLTTSGTYSFLVTITDSATTQVQVVTSPVSVIVYQVPNVAISPSTSNMIVGQTMTFTSLLDTGNGPFEDVATYEWQLGDSSGPSGVPLGSLSTYDFTTDGAGATVTNPGTYYLWLTISDTYGEYADSYATIDVYTVPSILNDPTSGIIDTGQFFILSATVQDGSGIFSWQWYVGIPGSGTPILGATDIGSTATFYASPSASEFYYVVFTDVGIDSGATPATLSYVTSSTAIIAVNPELVAPVIAISNDYIDDGQSAVLSIITPSSGGTAPFNYEWYVSSDAFAYISLSSSDGNSPLPTGLLSAGTYYYFLEVIDSASTSSDVASNTVMITVNEAMTSSSVDIGISNSEIDYGQSTLLYVNSFDGSGTAPYEAQWYLMAPGEVDFSYLGDQFIFDPTSLPQLALSPDILYEGGTWAFEISVTDSGSPAMTVYSNTLTLTVDPELTVYISGPSLIDSTQSTHLTAVAAGGSYSYTNYQWYLDSFSNPVGINSDTFDLSSLSEGVYTFYVDVTDTNLNTVSSDPFYVTVNSELIAPSINTTKAYLDLGQSLYLSSSEMTTGTYPYYYQWYVDGSPIDTSSYPTAATGSMVFATSLFGNGTGTYTFYLEVTDSAPSPMAVDSAIATVVVNAALVAPDVSSSTGALDQGDSQIFYLDTVTTGTAPYYYQWSYWNGDGFSAIVGADGDAYSFSTTMETTPGIYYLQVTVTDSATVPTNAVSSTIEISVYQVPNVVITPSVATIAIGQAMSFASVVSTGDGPFAETVSYEWRLGDSSSPIGPVLGTEPSYYFTTDGTGTTVTATGTYYLWVTTGDAVGTYANSYVAVTVVEAPSISANPSNAVIDSGQSVTLSAAAEYGSETMSWQWYSGAPGSGTPIPDATGTGLIATYVASLATSETFYIIFTDTGITDGATPSSVGVVTSSAAVVTVNPAPYISTNLSSVLIDDGQTITLTAVVNGGTGPYSWQWYDSYGIMGVPGAGTTAVLAISSTHTGVYVMFTDVGVSESATPTSAAQATTNAIDAVAAPAPYVSTVDTSYIIDTNQSIVIQVAGGSGTFTWQWYSGVPGSGSLINGESGAGISAQYAPVLSGTYYVVFTDVGVSTGATPVMTAEWSFTVSVYPELSGSVALSVGSSSTITAGYTTTLSVTPSGGTGSFTFQWAMSTTGVGGPYVNITGRTSSIFVFDSTGLPAGIYWLIVWVTDPGTDPYTIQSVPISITVTPPVSSIPYYSVTFTETGLPPGAPWYVNITNRQSSGAITVSQYTIYLPQGIYDYTVSTSYTANVGETTYAPSSPSGTFTVSSSSVTTTVAFTPVQFPVVFSETGLPAGIAWYVNVTSSTGGEQSFSSAADTITFYESNGTYTYTISTDNNLYIPYPTAGQMVINGTAGFSITIDFSLETYGVLFTELGLPTGTGWTVTFSDGEYATSTSSTISFLEPNGTYNYSITTGLSGFYASPSSGTTVVNGTDVTVEVTFNQTEYSVEFRETGLPTGSPWSVSLDGQTTTSTGETIIFLVPAGVYHYIIGEVTGFVLPSSTGTITVTNASIDIPITFQKLYPVMVTESGLPTGSMWYFNVTGGQSYSSSTSTITFQEPVGTYQYTIGSLNKTYAAVNLSGQFTVVTAASVYASFSPVTYSLSFTQSGLPTGTTWAISLNGEVKSSATTSIIFNATNGTYQFAIGTLNGYKTDVYSGVIRVEGNSVINTISWEKSTSAIYLIQSGIPDGTVWSATLTGTTFDNTTIDLTVSSTKDQIVFSVPNGTYRYTVHSPLWWVVSNAEGTISVPGASTSVTINATWIAVYLVVIIAALVVLVVVIGTIVSFRRVHK
ncbi:MAG: hypothetical protein M1556_04625 [Candidatus Thermoplasmatota archaeon]|nr:hypothetical protein [Candidatus Thermoplasmatota archaeon]